MDKKNSSNKCALSASPSRSPTTTNIKKAKKFVTPNRFAALTLQESESLPMTMNH